MQGEDDDTEPEQINAIVDRITGDLAEPLAGEQTSPPSSA